jgi:plasmid replication initiation protein
VFVELNKKSLVVQSNKLIEARYRLSVEEQKIVKILISQIRKDDKDFQDYEFRIKDLAELLGLITAKLSPSAICIQLTDFYCEK